MAIPAAVTLISALKKAKKKLKKEKKKKFGDPPSLRPEASLQSLGGISPTVIPKRGLRG